MSVWRSSSSGPKAYRSIRPTTSSSPRTSAHSFDLSCSNHPMLSPTLPTDPFYSLNTDSDDELSVAETTYIIHDPHTPSPTPHPTNPLFRLPLFASASRTSVQAAIYTSSARSRYSTIPTICGRRRREGNAF